MKYHPDLLELIEILKSNGFSYFGTRLVLEGEVISYMTDISIKGNYVQVTDFNNSNFLDRNILNIPTFIRESMLDFCGMAYSEDMIKSDFLSFYKTNGNVSDFSDNICRGRYNKDDLCDGEYVTSFFNDRKKFLKWNLSN